MEPEEIAKILKDCKPFAPSESGWSILIEEDREIWAHKMEVWRNTVMQFGIFISRNKLMPVTKFTELCGFNQR